MTKPEKHMVLSLFMLVSGYHYDSWRLEGTRSEELGYLDFMVELAQKAEAAKLDQVFFADVVSAGPIPGSDPTTAGHYEPVSTLGALSHATKKIGLIGTISTSFTEPFNAARYLAGIDTLSGGRAGWNIVTSWMGNENFGLDEMPPPAERYRRAEEFIEVTNKLWDSWSDDAVINDKETGWWADPNKIRAIDHEGEFFKVKGPLNMRRSPQGRPVLVQAGSSPEGVEFGTSIADAIYTAQPDRRRAIEFYEHFKNLVAQKGRDPKQVKILPGILPILGETEKDAKDFENELASKVNMELGRKRLENGMKGIDISDIDLDEKIPDERWDSDPSRGSRYEIHKFRSIEDGFTLRELILDSARSMSHLSITGTPSKVADLMVDWFENKACDGFSLNPPSMPVGLERICDLLVPELQERGYFREEYEGNTLRDHLGLDRPGAWDA